MTKEQKIAIAKVIREMIKADSLIDESEIIDMQNLLELYSITGEHISCLYTFCKTKLESPKIVIA